ncbi:MAG: hypothetical protein GF317_09135 [Candidatus Lokiarchaeota archaeon]|nr:hypothetical protein [Candidatus Lokiarchaeota archaeon]
MNYKKLKDWNSGFSRWVIYRHPENSKRQNGFMGGFIFGERGTGKSTYCYKAEAKTYYDLNGYNKTDDEEEAYKLALECMIYEPTDFRKLLIYNKIRRIITPIICLDDASMHFGNMLHITDPKIYSALLGETATVRTAVTGFLINAPKRKHVAKFLRDYDDFKGEVKEDHTGGFSNQPTWQRKVRFYRWNYYPDEVKYRIQIPFQDKYSCFIPEPYYKWYIEKKRYYELKHEMQIADKVDKTARIIFIDNKKEIPREFWKQIEKWEKEEN